MVGQCEYCHRPAPTPLQRLFGGGKGSVPRRGAGGRRVTGLTEKQKQALGWIERGLTRRAAALEAGISENTVKERVETVLRKTGHRTQRDFRQAMPPKAEGLTRRQRRILAAAEQYRWAMLDPAASDLRAEMAEALNDAIMEGEPEGVQ